MRDHGLFGLHESTIVVIGAGSGIGESIAIACGQQGAHVVCADVNEAPARAVAARVKETGGQAEAAALDVRNAQALAELFDRLRLQRGGLDGVVSTPGINVRKPLLAYSEEEFDRVVSVNLKGAFNVVREAGRVMVEQRRGSIVMFSSIRAITVEPGQSVYAATKAAVVQLVRTAAVEFGQAGVRVNAIAPGVVETPLTAPIKANPAWYEAYAQKNVLKRWASADEMAGPAVFLLSDAASYVTGSLLLVDGGWTAADGRFQPPGM
ncbi:MAG TPA: SDR family oxidoreductase [Vicinamibacterales bacterium]|nr:SDR family oxidoreductase [Vicinamibacterales bacterium]